MPTVPAELQIWVRKRGTKQVFQLTPQMAEHDPPREDLIEITKAEAMKLQKEHVAEKEQACIERRLKRASEAWRQRQAKQAVLENEAAALAEEKAALQQAMAAQQRVIDQAGEAAEAEAAKLKDATAYEDLPEADPADVAAAGPPKTPEEIEAELAAKENAAAGGESGAVRQDNLDELKRDGLMAAIDELKAKGVDIKKKGTNKALIAAIREGRRMLEQMPPQE